MELSEAQIAELGARIAAADARTSAAKLKLAVLGEIEKDLDKKIAELKAERSDDCTPLSTGAPHRAFRP